MMELLWSCRPELFCRKSVLRNFATFIGKQLRQSPFLIKACNFIKKETLAQMFSCKFFEISKNTLFLQNTSGFFSKKAFNRDVWWSAEYVFINTCLKSQSCIYLNFWKIKNKLLRLIFSVNDFLVASCLKLVSNLTKKIFSLLYWKSFKNDEKWFLFHLKSYFRS